MLHQGISQVVAFLDLKWHPERPHINRADTLHFLLCFNPYWTVVRSHDLRTKGHAKDAINPKIQSQMKVFGRLGPLILFKSSWVSRFNVIKNSPRSTPARIPVAAASGVMLFFESSELSKTLQSSGFLFCSFSNASVVMVPGYEQWTRIDCCFWYSINSRRRVSARALRAVLVGV